MKRVTVGDVIVGVLAWALLAGALVAFWGWWIGLAAGVLFSVGGLAKWLGYIR